MIPVTDHEKTSLLFASKRRPGSTTEGRNAFQEGHQNGPRIPKPSATPNSCANDSEPNAYDTGTDATRAAAISSVAINRRCRDTRSTHTPANRPRRIPGAAPTALSTPIWLGEARSVITATSGRAKVDTPEPIIEMLSPSQNRTNCFWPQIGERRERRAMRIARTIVAYPGRR